MKNRTRARVSPWRRRQPHCPFKSSPSRGHVGQVRLAPNSPEKSREASAEQLGSPLPLAWCRGQHRAVGSVGSRPVPQRMKTRFATRQALPGIPLPSPGPSRVPEEMKEAASAAGASHRVQERQWLLRPAALIYRRRHDGR